MNQRKKTTRKSKLDTEKESKNNIFDFESSPLRFEMEIFLQEYRDLRAEILLRLGNGQQILNYTITLIVVSVTILQLEPQIVQVTGSATSIRIILLSISILFAALGLMYIEQDMFMAMIGRYITHVLSPKLNRIVRTVNDERSSVLGWEEYKINYSFKPPMVFVFGYLSAARYALPIFPPLILLAYYLTRRSAEVVALSENLLFGLSIFAITTTITVSIIDGLTYLRTDKEISTSSEPGSLKKRLLSRFISKGYYVPIITVLLGIFPMMVLSLNSQTFWLNSSVEFPLLSIPTIFIGDTLLLPLFNYRVFHLLSQSKLEKFVLLTRLGVSMAASYLLNTYTHTMWVRDPYLGFMDTEYGILSSAGVWHFWFSVLQLAAVILFLWISVDFYRQKRITALIDTYETWFIILLFSSLSIFDFIVRYTIIFQGESVLMAIFQEITTFTTLIVSILIYIIFRMAINKLRSS